MTEFAAQEGILAVLRNRNRKALKEISPHYIKRRRGPQAIWRYVILVERRMLKRIKVQLPPRNNLGSGRAILEIA
jgi:hypothetical protein